MAKTDVSVISTDINLIGAIRARHAALTNELTTLNSMLAALGGESSEESATPRRKRRGRPAKASSGKRGRPKGSKNKPTAKATRKTAAGKRGRPKGSSNNGMSLIRAVATVLAEASEPMKVAQIADAVNKLGYKSSAASFKTMVSQTLGKLSEAKVAKSSERGIWESSNGISKYLENLTEAAAAEEATTVSNDNIPI